MNILSFIKGQAAKLRDNFIEVYAYIFVSFGLPTVFYIYADLRAAVTAFIVIQAIIGILAMLRGVDA